MGDNLAQEAGLKYRPYQELHFDDVGELLAIDAEDVAKLTGIRAWSGIDPVSGNKTVIWSAMFNSSSEAIDLTTYGNMDIGSELLVYDSGTLRICKKIAKSSTAVIGDWYYVNMTVVT